MGNQARPLMGSVSVSVGVEKCKGGIVNASAALARFGGG
jgi:hypothetical protein